MDARLWLVFLLLALAMVVQSSSSSSSSPSLGHSEWLARFSDGEGGLTNNVLVGDLIDENEEMMLDSESARRSLGGRGRFISYAAMKRNAIPCNRRGRSYYNCYTRSRANPYRRGCSRITNCARDY